MEALTLRISVLEHCQLRCGYCLPEAQSLLAKKAWLNLSQYETIARIFARFSFKKIRFTGGEPLLRQELPQIIQSFARRIPQAPLALTTNGQRLSKLAEALKDAGLHTITLHIDSLKEERYERLMGRGKLKKALIALECAQALELCPKINMVVQRGLNDDELYAFLEFSKRYGVPVRFIELMDTGSARSFIAKHFMSGREIIAQLGELGITALARAHASDPAQLFFSEKLGLSFGLIASDTEPFCADCDRLRLSANGHLFSCLYAPQGHALSFNCDDEILFAQVLQTITKKQSFHPSLTNKRRLFSMSQTGG